MCVIDWLIVLTFEFRLQVCPLWAGESCCAEVCERSSIRQILIYFNLDMSELTWLEVDCGLFLLLCLHCRCRCVCVMSVMDVLQMVSAPSNYAVDTGGSPAQRSLRTRHTHTHTHCASVKLTFSLKVCSSWKCQCRLHICTVSRLRAPLLLFPLTHLFLFPCN